MDLNDIADEEPQTYADELLREVALSLGCEGGRVFVQSATSENLESCTIELKCAWSPRLATMFDETSSASAPKSYIAFVGAGLFALSTAAARALSS